MDVHCAGTLPGTPARLHAPGQAKASQQAPQGLRRPARSLAQVAVGGHPLRLHRHAQHHAHPA
eukprot:7472991-Alexandrium_andersonii.AAC.1